MREWRGIIEKVAEGEGKGLREKMKGNEKGEGTGKGNSTLVVGDIRLCQWGLEKNEFRVFWASQSTSG